MSDPGWACANAILNEAGPVRSVGGEPRDEWSIRCPFCTKDTAVVERVEVTDSALNLHCKHASCGSAWLHSYKHKSAAVVRLPDWMYENE